MKIAIIDGMNQDIGLKILFPEADYFICNTEVDKSFNMNKYSIIPRKDIENINDTNYDILFVIISKYYHNIIIYILYIYEFWIYYTNMHNK